MLIVISPAKKIGYKEPKFFKDTTFPYFEKESLELVDELKKLSVIEIGKVMSISPKLSDLNFERFLKWDSPLSVNNLRPSVFMFQGDVYQGLRADTFNNAQIVFMQKHLRILSGLYGVLRPLDLIQEYRLEMGTKLNNAKGKDLYEFWGNKITDNINKSIEAQGDNILINLASDEYFKSLNIKNIQAKIIKPIFKDEKNGQYKTISFYAKKARGLMTRFIIENNIKDENDLKAFDSGGYTFSKEYSKVDELIFIR